MKTKQQIVSKCILISLFCLFFTLKSNAQYWVYGGTTNAGPTGYLVNGTPGSSIIFGANNTNQMTLTTNGDLNILGGANGYQISSNYVLWQNAIVSNIYVGVGAGNGTGTGGLNTACGYSALSSFTTGLGNSATGAYSLYNNTTGKKNTALGDKAGYKNITGSHNTYVGANADANDSNYNNSTAIGNGTTITASNQMNISGNGHITSFVVPNTTGAKPANPSVPVAWEKVTLSGNTYYVALYQ